MALTGKQTKKLVENLSAGRHVDGGGLHLVVDPSGARHWIVRVVVKGQKNKKGGPLRTDFGLGGADIVTLNQARERALEYRRMAKQGLNPRFTATREVPTFEEIAQQVHIDRMPTWKSQKHGQQWMTTLRDYAFPKIGRMPVDSIHQRDVLMCLYPIWTEKHETARRLSQRIKIVLDVARSKGFRTGENPVTAIHEAQILPEVRVKPKHHKAMAWQDIPAFYADLKTRDSMTASALRFTCLGGSRTNEVLGTRNDLPLNTLLTLRWHALWAEGADYPYMSLPPRDRIAKTVGLLRKFTTRRGCKFPWVWVQENPKCDHGGLRWHLAFHSKSEWHADLTSYVEAHFGLDRLVLSRFSSGLFRAMFAMKEIENGKEIHRRVSA